MQGQEAEEADRRGRRHGEARGAVQGAHLARLLVVLWLAVLAVSSAGVQLTRGAEVQHAAGQSCVELGSASHLGAFCMQ